MKEKLTSTQKALNLWAIVLIIWSVYRTYFRMPEWFDEVVAKPLVFVLPVLYYIRRIDHRGILESLYLNLKPKKIISDIIFSLVVGLIFLGSLAGAMSLRFSKLTLPEK